jgi:hypothetical protein
MLMSTQVRPSSRGLYRFFPANAGSARANAEDHLHEEGDRLDGPLCATAAGQPVSLEDRFDARVGGHGLAHRHVRADEGVGPLSHQGPPAQTKERSRRVVAPP